MLDESILAIADLQEGSQATISKLTDRNYVNKD
jgi:hypothetical protein